MAAWLTYLKSRLLLPKKNDTEEPSSEELEEAVKFQLKRLQAMQNISKILSSNGVLCMEMKKTNLIETEDNIRVKYYGNTQVVFWKINRSRIQECQLHS